MIKLWIFIELWMNEMSWLQRSHPHDPGVIIANDFPESPRVLGLITAPVRAPLSKLHNQITSSLNCGIELEIKGKTLGWMLIVFYLYNSEKWDCCSSPMINKSLDQHVVASLHHSHRSQPAEVRRVALIYSKLHHHPLCALSTLNWLILHTSTRDWIWIYMLFITARFIYTI